jgi:hypothetical protein
MLANDARRVDGNKCPIRQGFSWAFVLLRDTIVTAPTPPIGCDPRLCQSDREQTCSTDEQGPRDAGGAVGREHPGSNGQGQRGGDEPPAPPSSHRLSPQVTME